MALLEVKHLHTFFKTRKGIVKAVNDVSYSLEPGRTIGIVGESGSGKSVSAMSILRLLDGNGYIDSGEVLFEGEDLTKMKLNDLYKVRGDKISVIFQEPMTSLNPVFTVGYQIGEVLRLHKGMDFRQARMRAVELLGEVGIADPERKVDAWPHQLSGGQQQRVAIARALAAQPPVILADEPTGNLDSASSKEILQILKNMHKQGKTVILITHDNGIAAQARRVVRIIDGKIESDFINKNYGKKEYVKNQLDA